MRPSKIGVVFTRMGVHTCGNSSQRLCSVFSTSFALYRGRISKMFLAFVFSANVF